VSVCVVTGLQLLIVLLRPLNILNTPRAEGWFSPQRLNGFHGPPPFLGRLTVKTRNRPFDDGHGKAASSNCENNGARGASLPSTDSFTIAMVRTTPFATKAFPSGIQFARNQPIPIVLASCVSRSTTRIRGAAFSCLKQQAIFFPSGDQLGQSPCRHRTRPSGRRERNTATPDRCSPASRSSAPSRPDPSAEPGRLHPRPRAPDRPDRASVHPSWHPERQ
jgi:hypothetical protein